MTRLSSSPPASSKPPKVDVPPISAAPTQPSTDVNNPTDGTTKVDESGDTWTFIEGKWWNDGPMNQQMVDDSERVIYCPFCELEPKDCTCAPIGY